jgi:hypothetical protein
MKILILGTGKSGTTALLYKVAGGLPNCQAFSGGQPGKYLGNYENAVYKHTYEKRKGKSFDLYSEHLRKVHYDCKIWMARDPRDAAVSAMLYRWHKGHRKSKKQYQAHLELILKKEQDPRSVPFHVICRYIGPTGWPITTEEVVEPQLIRYRRMSEFVSSLGSDWFLYTFEDMVSKNFDALNEYLGFEVQGAAEVLKSTGKAKVIRKKAVGDWRHWFTEEDVRLFKPAYLPYMEVIGYDCEDWTLSENPFIEPEYSSMYMQRLAQMKSIDSIRRIKDSVLQRFSRKS